jgi:predicted secreted protein
MVAKKKKSLPTKLTKLAGIIITLAIFIAALSTIFDFFDRPQKYESGSLSEESLEKTDSLKQQEPGKEAVTLDDSNKTQVHAPDHTETGAKAEINHNYPIQDTIDKINYEVKLVIPPRMSDARVFVDGESADIVDRNYLTITIRVTEKQTSRTITVTKDDYECTEEQMIDRDSIVLILCQ